MAEVEIRPYRREDWAAVYQIAADTAFIGDPLERYLDNRQIFYDAFYRYYTELEPEHGWVACEGETVVGFLMGCLDTATQRRRLFREILPPVAWRLLTGKYSVGSRTRSYGWHLLQAALRGEIVHCDLDLYPAHLHLNISAHSRGFGLGRRLMLVYLDQLGRLGVPGVHLSTTDRNYAACHLYESMGFQAVAAHRTRIWEHLVEGRVENRIYARRLGRI